MKLNTEKSRLIEFGKDARRERNEKGEGRPDTFNFLGFTHSCSVTFKERKYKILRRCISKRLQRKINEVYKKLRYLILSCDIEKAITWVNQFLKGYYTYFAVHDNLGALKTLRYRILLIIWKFMNRRSQKAYVSSEKFFATIPSRIVKPKVKHAYPSERLEKRQETLRNFRQGITKAKSVS